MSDEPSFSTRFPAPPVAIHGVPFDNLALPEAVRAVSRLIEAGVPQYVICADSGLLLRGRKDAELRRVFSDASVVLASSGVLRLASRLLGNGLAARISPVAFAQALNQRATDRKLKVARLGAIGRLTDGALAHGALQIEAIASPFENSSEGSSRALTEIQRLKPDLLWFSTRNSELPKWLAGHIRELGVPVCIGIPANSDRGLDALTLLFSLGPQFWKLRLQKRSEGKRSISAPLQAEIDWRSIKLPERLDLEAVNNDVLLLDQLLADGRHCLLDMSAVRFIDSTGIGYLVRLQKRIRGTGRQLVLLAPSDQTQRTLELVNLESFFAAAQTEDNALALIHARTLEQPVIAAPAGSSGVETMVWRGEITHANAESVWTATAELVRRIAPGLGRLELDLSQLRFVDNSGLNVMVRTRKLALERGLQLQIRLPQGPVRQALRLAGLEDYILGTGTRS